MLINLSNQSHDNWGMKQKEAARKLYEEIVDLPFPSIPADSDTNAVYDYAKQYAEKCRELIKRIGSHRYFDGVLVEGELTFSYAVVNLLINMNIRCIAGSFQPLDDSEETPIQKFEFVRFRDYI